MVDATAPTSFRFPISWDRESIALLSLWHHVSQGVISARIFTVLGQRVLKFGEPCWLDV